MVAINTKYSYDPLGQRIKSEEILTTKGTKSTDSLMSGMFELARKTDGIEQYHTLGLDLAGSLTATGGVGAVLASSSYADTLCLLPNASFSYLYDGNGNVISACDSRGSITAKLAYSPFGELLPSTTDASCLLPNASSIPFTFSTKPVDASGLAYYGFRFYNPTLGRWLSRDPIEEKGGRNLYQFVKNSPYGELDYLGLFRFDELLSSWSFGSWSFGVSWYYKFGTDFGCSFTEGSEDCCDKNNILIKDGLKKKYVNCTVASHNLLSS